MDRYCTHRGKKNHTVYTYWDLHGRLPQFHLGVNVTTAESDPGSMTSVPVYSSKDAAKGETIQLSKV